MPARRTPAAIVAHDADDPPSANAKGKGMTRLFHLLTHRETDFNLKPIGKARAVEETRSDDGRRVVHER